MIIINKDLCKKDCHCINDCPVKLFSQDEEGFPVVRKAASRLCLRCGHCEAVCPHDALHLDYSEEKLPHIKPLISPEELENFLSSRRSVRRFKNKTIEKSLLEKILLHAQYAPSAKNVHPINWTVIFGFDSMKTLLEKSMDIAKEVPSLKGLVRAYENGEDPLFYNAPCIIVGHCKPEISPEAEQDISIGTSYVELLAHSHGLGTCWIGFFTRILQENAELRTEYGIPEGHHVHASLILGYSKVVYKRIPTRLAPVTTWIE